MSYKVFLVDSLGAPQNHHAIFVETNEDGSGQIFQVTGNIQKEMMHGHKSGKKPEESNTYISKQQIGTVTIANYERIESILNAIQPPKKQFDGPRRLYPTEPIRRCQEWTAEAVQALKDAGVLEG